MNQPNLEAVREQVLRIARQIEQLCQSEIAPNDFFPQFLQLLAEAIAAEAAVFWRLDENRQIGLAYEVGLSQIGLSDAPAALTNNQRLLADALGTGQTILLHPENPMGRELPLNKQIILSPLKIGRDCVGVIEVFQRVETAPGARRGFMQFVERMCAAASQYLARRQKEESRPETDETYLESFSRYLYGLQRGRNLKETAYVAASDGRMILDTDRVSVVVRRGRKTEVLAVSGQERVHKRANLVRTMRQLAENVINSGQTLVYTGSQAEWPPEIEQQLAHFVEEGRARMILMVPIKEPPPLIGYNDEDDQKQEKTAEEGKTFGCLVVEQMSEGALSPRLRNRVDLVAGHVAAGLYSARSQERIFLLPLWRRIGSIREWLVGRRLVKTLIALAVILLVVGVMVLVPWDYRVTGEGRLMPVEQQHVFAPEDGDVEDITVKGGQRVKQGDVLLTLRNDQLENEYLALTHQLEQQKKRKTTLLGRIETIRVVNDEALAQRDDLLGQLEETRISIDDLTERVAKITHRREQLTVKAPRDGVVATFQLRQKLRGRPVSRGEVLLEIMNDQGDWQLELDVSADRLGHLLDGYGRLDTKQLPTEYILATRPEYTYVGVVEDLGTRAEVSQEEGLVLPVIVDIDAQALPAEDRRIGAEVQAKISTGNRSLGYCLFGDVIEFFQRTFWL